MAPPASKWNVTVLSKNTFPKLKDLQYFLFDCDGVLWNGNSLIDGAKDLIEYLQRNNKKIFLITNNSSKSRRQYVAKCRKLGFEVTEDDIICTANVAARYLQKIEFRGKVLVVGMEGLDEELTLANIDHVMAPTLPGVFTSDNIEELQLDPSITAVLVGFDVGFTYNKGLLAASYIHRGARFFATNIDSFFPPAQNGGVLPGTGSIVSLVQVAGGRPPEAFMGKPHDPMMEVLEKDFGVQPDRSLIVGDRLDTDVQFGKRHGITSLVVLTGVTKEAQLMGPLEPLLTPDYRVDSVRDLLNELQQ